MENSIDIKKLAKCAMLNLEKDGAEGMQAAVVPIIFVAALKLRKGAFSYGVCRWVTVIGCILSLLLNVNCVWIIVFGMMCGFLISWWKGGSL